MTAGTSPTWTTRTLIAWMADAFKKKGLDRPRLLAEDLLAHVIGSTRLKLYTDPERLASEDERAQLRDLVQRALKHEPVQYLVGREHFFGLQMKVDRRVLIPRPSTQTIVEEVLQHARAQSGGVAKGEGILIADICTGSGCIAIALLKNLPAARAVAADLSADALAVATENAHTHQVADRLDLLQGDLLTPLAQHPVARAERSLRYLVSNPPYIPDHEWDAVEPNVKDHEPHLALRGGTDGLDFIRTVFTSGTPLLQPGGVIAVEVATSHAEAAADLARAQSRLRDIRIIADCDSLPRVILATAE